MSVTVKICGLREAASVEAALAAGADMVGFVFFEGSPRHITFSDARRLGQQVGTRARKVALTADADDSVLAAIVDALKPDILQLHGHETPKRLATVRARFGLPIMKAIALATPGDLDLVAPYENVADHLLFDARPPDDATRPGGNGDAFDWSLLRTAPTRRLWLLAGGLHCDNVERALRMTGAPGVDVSSGVERAPGIKDLDKITQFVAAARTASVEAVLHRSGPGSQI